MENRWLLLLFFSVFHVIGAAVLGSTLRSLWTGLRRGQFEGCRAIVLLVWATMFGCIPFGLGVGTARSEPGPPVTLIAQILVWSSAFLASLFAGDAWREALSPFVHEEILLMLLGGGFLVGGVAVAGFFPRGDGPSTLLFGGLFGLVGAVIFGHGLSRLLRSTR